MEIDWNKYAKEYDIMCKYNPEYWKLLKKINKAVNKLNLKNTTICEFGSGTGNVLLNSIITAVKKSTFYSLEYNKEFLKHQSKKFKNLKENINIIQTDIRNHYFKEKKIDLAVMVHVLNFFEKSERKTILKNISDSLAPGGYFIIADIGRPINILKWTFIIYSNAFLKNQLKGIKELYANSSQIRKQNINARKRQDNKISYLHNLTDFATTIKEFGFDIIEMNNECYAGIDDLIIAKKI